MSAPGNSLDGSGLIAEGCSQEPVSGAGTIYLGYGTQGTWFNGYLNEVAYYGHALSESTVTTLTNDDPPFTKPRSAATKVGSPAASGKAKAVIDKVKIDQKRHAARFTFKATSASGFQCALVKNANNGKTQAKPHFARCTSPKTYTHLKPGKYRFEVRALSAAGVGQPAGRSFTIR